MRNIIDQYIMDYRDPDKKEREKVYINPVQTSNEVEDRTVIRQSKGVIRKLVATTFLFLAVTVVVYQAISFKEKPVLLDKMDFGGNIRQYDDFIFPIVMQDPKPFDKIEEADPNMLISSSLWRLLLLNRVNEFDEDGLLLINADDMWENYDALFGDEYRPSLMDDIENELFKFNRNENKFHIKPCSNQVCYIPYTQSCSVEEHKITLEVGYVSPNDKWRSLKPDRPDKPEPVKVVQYNLDNHSSGKTHVCSIAG